MNAKPDIEITLSGNGDEDGEKLVRQLDDNTSDIVPLEAYAEYLRGIASALKERANQVDDEVG